jgi:phosphoenolpyruvate carboxykinase (ATP)
LEAGVQMAVSDIEVGKQNERRKASKMDASLLSQYGLQPKVLLRNSTAAQLYEEALRVEPNSYVTDKGALVAYSGLKTGRSPKDKRIVFGSESSKNIWWGDVNMRIDEAQFDDKRRIALDFLKSRERLYVFDGFAGWDPQYQIKVRVICSRPYHALFMNNMLIRPTKEQLENFGEPDYVILNAGPAAANEGDAAKGSTTCVSLNFEKKEFVILGTEYAGEMKKGVFTIMNYIMPLKNVLSLHCSVNEGPKGDVSIFLGLSGTGKTTLSADPHRKLIGDDEHCWADTGIFNIEGGCYAKCVDLSEEKEPDIYHAIRFGSLLENIKFKAGSREVDFSDISITENTRASYPIEFISNAKIPCVTGHGNNIIFLTADAFGVLPPISRLSPEQAMYHFMSGYTAKVAGTETGVTEPKATFSACFGAAFMVWHPSKYAQLLAEKMRKHHCKAWLVNTGWTGGPYGVGSRIKLSHTRAIIDAIHNGSLNSATFTKDATFGFEVPTQVANVPTEILNPRNTWKDATAYDEQKQKLTVLFQNNFKAFEAGSSKEIVAAGPQLAR